MITIDHLSLGVADVSAARQFYGALLAPMGIRCLAEGEGFA
ncbi:MAG: VOC family protein, partial [Rhodospirillaceae bacterium]|nr:VOC family protein [Rhodospirillaceae bacterium]